jgi:ATP-dependent DNA helicase RecG
VLDIEKLLTLPESKTLEFKRDVSSLDPILKTIVAFANTSGGVLIIGKASDGTLSGVKDVLEAEEMLANSIADTIKPAILPEIEIITINKKDLLVIQVSHWKGPFYLKKEGTPKGVYIRLGSTSRPASPELLAELQRSVLNVYFDQQPLPDLSKDDLDIEKAFKILRTVDKHATEEKLLSLGVLTRSGARLVPSIGGLILFGKTTIREQLIPDARVSCARFLGSDKINILDRLEVEGTIVDAVEEVTKFIRRNTRLSAEIKTMRRKDIPEYSPEAVREALINAFAHTDYSMTGSRIQIAIFDNRLEIINPGMLPFGFTLDDLKTGISRIRNRVIVRVFHKLEFMEEWGSGYKRIIEACRDGGYPEPRWEELGTMMRVVFYPSAQTVLAHKELPVAKLEEFTDREKAILRLFEKRDSLHFREIFEHIVPPISERMLRYNLAELKRKGVLDSKGMGRAIVWQRV